jgi:hypothetical protein
MVRPLFLILTTMILFQDPDPVPDTHDYTKGSGIIELPCGFGKTKYLSDMAPGSYFWSEGEQRVYQVLEGQRYCDPETGESWEYGESTCGAVCTLTVRPNSFDVRPWSAPEREKD